MQKAEGGAAGTVFISSMSGAGSANTKLILDNQGNYPRVGKYCVLILYFTYVLICSNMSVVTSYLNLVNP